MKRTRIGRSAMALVVAMCFLVVGCAGTMNQSPGQAALVCGAGGAAAGAAIGAAAARNWQGALIGAAAGALAGGLTCFAVAEYRSRQVRDYRETQQAINYNPAAGDAIQITHYTITPAAAAPGTEVAFNATYHVMTPDADRDVPITEVRILKVYDPQAKSYRELGRVPNQVTVKPGTRQADGKFQVRSGVAEGQYQVVFQIAKDTSNDTRELPLVVTTNQAVLGDPRARVVEVSAPGAKRVEPGPVPATPAAPLAATPTPVSSARQAPLATLGEQQPTAPPPPVVSTPPTRRPVQPVAPAPSSAAQSATPRPTPPAQSSVGAGAPSSGSTVGSGAPTGSAAPLTAAIPRGTYFVASKVSGKGNLRAGPGGRHNVVGTISQGDRFEIVDRVVNPGEPTPWFKVRLDNGTEAWVAGSLGEVHE